MGEERRTLVLVNLAGIMERADEALLPAVYKEVGAALHATPTGLGSLTLLRSIVQAACYPLATYMAVRYNRTHVIALGAFLWAAATFLVALSNTFLQNLMGFSGFIVYVFSRVLARSQIEF
ncbi:UNE2 [Cocos nucifera]|nr:UNE2 [Cocos nucifera]